MAETRRLIDLYSVGPSIVADFELLGITRVEQLVGQDADQLYSRLIEITGKHIDICCADVFKAAIAQAEDPDLPEDRKRWYYWSKVRKQG